jgi:hypothetical protein
MTWSVCLISSLRTVKAASAYSAPVSYAAPAAAAASAAWLNISNVGMLAVYPRVGTIATIWPLQLEGFPLLPVHSTVEDDLAWLQ